MLFTRTIRRTMLVGLVLILTMLTTLTVSGISGLLSYRNAVHDLEFSIQKAPRRAELVEAVGLLFEPLVVDLPHTEDAAQFQHDEFALRLTQTRADVAAFQRKLDALPPSHAVRAKKPITMPLLTEINDRLNRLATMQSGLKQSETRAVTAQRMLSEVAYIQIVARRIPDHKAGLGVTLREARREYRSRFYWVCGTSAATWILSLLLVRYGYVWVFKPLQTLHRGARRVAQGDFDYRLKITNRDEMAELADAFNQMTARFQEIAQDLDRQVRERSRQLVRSERMADVGFLAAGVAHEINNPLQAILTASDSLESRAAEFMPHVDENEARVIRLYLEMIQRESTRCKQITARLLDFARAQDSTRMEVDLTALIVEVIQLVGLLSKFRDRTILFEQPKPCYIEANGAEIKQVVLNIVANGLESMETGGKMSIELIEQTDQVQIRFTDDGCGMTQEVIANLFEPFFTRRKNGKGTGLGLSISHRIVSDHGGTIEATSNGPGTGSRFHIRLPRRAAISNAA